MKPLAITALPTRKCNLNCQYCKIKNNNFPNELNWEQWIVGLEKLYRQFDSLCFTCLLGGDITVWKDDLVKFVKGMSSTGIFYSFTTNGLLLTENFLKKLKENGLDSISVSLDSLKLRKDKFEYIKSQKTLVLLDLLNKLGFKELHCTITVDKINLTELPEIVRFLTKNKVVSEITPLIFGKTKAYDYASSREDLKDRILTTRDKYQVDEIMSKLVEMKRQGYLIHNTDNYLLNWSRYGIKQQWKCRYPIKLVLDADGTMRLCLHIKGDLVTRHNISNLNFKTFLRDWRKDFKKLCHGCYWNCQYEPKYIYEKTKDFKSVINYFNHRVKYAEKKIKKSKT